MPTWWKIGEASTLSISNNVSTHLINNSAVMTRDMCINVYNLLQVLYKWQIVNQGKY